MSTKIPVSALYKYCKQMQEEQWGYIWGAAGVLWTEARQKAATNDMTVKYGSKWIGHMVVDCSGVMVYIWRKFDLKIPHGSNSIRRQSVGKLQTQPMPGYAAFKLRGDDYYHIGIVSEDGKFVYEAKGTIIGFTTSPVSEWDWFAPFKDVEYSEGVNPMPDTFLYEAKVTTESGSLRLRSKPDASSTVLTSIPKGTVVKVYGDEDGWSSVIYAGYAGFCSNKYLTRIDDPVETPVETEEYTILRRKDGVSVTLVGDWKVEEGDD